VQRAARLNGERCRARVVDAEEAGRDHHRPDDGDQDQHGHEQLPGLADAHQKLTGLTVLR